MMRSITLIRALVCGLPLVFLFGCSFPPNNLKPKAARFPPPISASVPVLYPGASNVNKTQSSYIIYVTYVTSDTPQDVNDFYRSALGKDGWMVDPIQIPTKPYSLSFSWWNGVEMSNYNYEVIITTENGKTKVDLKLANYPSM